MAINRVDITVQNLAALSLIWVSELEDGALAWVIADNSYYVLVKNSGAPPVGTTVISPAPGSPIAGNAGARWFFLEFGPDESASTQIPWFIDPVNGNDENDGLTAPTAINTFREFTDRVGNSVVNVGMIVTLMNDFPLSNPVYIDPIFRIGNTGTLTLKNGKTLTTLATGTLSGAAAITRGAGGGSQQTITDAALPVSWAAVGAINTTLGAMVRVRLTANGAIAYGTQETVLKTLMTGPFVIPASTPSGIPVQFTPVGNEAYVVETGFVFINDFSVEPTGNAIATPGPRLFAFEIALPNTALTGGVIGFWQTNNPNGASEVFFSACDVGRIQPHHCIFTTNACKWSGGANVYNKGLIALGSSVCTQVLNLQGMTSGSLLTLDTTCVLGGRLIVNVQNVRLEKFAVFNAVGAAIDGITVNPGGSVLATPFIGLPEAVYGTGNGRAGINCVGTGTFQYASVKPTITGVVDTRVQTVNLSYAQVPFINSKNSILYAGIIGALTGAVTRFVFPNYTQSATDDIGWVVDEPAILRILRIRSRTAAGAGGDAYTVFVNGVATPVTATMAAGGTTASDLVNFATVAAGDRVSFQIVEGAAGAADVMIALEVLALNSTNAGITASGAPGA